MKYLFLSIYALLGVASLTTALLNPVATSDVPVVYWVTDPNPARIEQVATFQRWLDSHPDYPRFTVLLDTANANEAKKVIQGVSGVGGDTMDVNSGAGLRYFNAIGLLEPVTDVAKELGYSLDTTYDAIRSELTVDGEQYLYPCSASVWANWIDRSLFEKYGVEQPPYRWDFDTFERIGKEYVAKANTPGERQTNFFIASMRVDLIHRSMGLGCFNETMTRCQLNDERYVKALELKHKWMYEDHLMPTGAEASSFTIESGYGGAELYLFGQGNYAIFPRGRYALIRLRELQQERLDRGEPLMDLDVLEMPHGGYPTTRTASRALGVYRGGKHVRLAEIFQSFLASREYNMQIVRDADALPANPAFTKTDAFTKPLPLLPDNIALMFGYQRDESQMLSEFKLDFYEALDNVNRDKPWSIRDLPRPPRSASLSQDEYQTRLAAFDASYEASLPVYRSEWGLHERFVKMMYEIAIPDDLCPFVVPDLVLREIKAVEDAHKNNLMTAQDAAQRAANRINAEIQRTLAEDPSKLPKYERFCEQQEAIDQLRASGQKVPAHLITNPFYVKYYRDMGWLSEGE